MESTQLKKYLPWIIGGCSLLVIFACVFTSIIGAGGILIANRAVKGIRTEGKHLSAATTPKTAVLQNLQGYVEVVSETGEWSPAEPDQAVAVGQHIRTGKLSSVSLLFNDGSQAILKAESEISIDELNVEKNGKLRAIVMTQVAGESTHQVVQNKRSDSHYKVLTPSGAGLAKGTEFQVIVTTQQIAYFYVIEGVVAVSAVETTVLVNPGFMTIIYLDQPPLAPVQAISVEGVVSQAGPQWTVAGTTFTADKETVIIGSPQVGNWAMIKGHLDDNNQNIADWVILLRSTLSNRFSLTGTVEEMDAGQWKVNGKTIVVTETTELDADIQLGDTVYVKGLIETGGVLQAYKIERIDEEKGMPFAITGILQETDGSRWVISGVKIETDETSTITKGLKPGDLVRVKGHILPDGVWLAKEITLVTEEDNEFSFTGELESRDPWKVAGISFETRDDTVIQSDLNIGDLVRVEGIIDAEGVWIATKIERIDPDSAGTMVLIGIVITIDPWVVSGIPLTLAPDADIDEPITVGMLVRVELILMPDGTWQVIKIEPVTSLIWFPGCIDVIATVVSIEGNQLQLLNWPQVTVTDDATIEGTLTPNSVIRMRICFNDAMIIQIIYIIIIQPGEIELPEVDEGGKVTICHKPSGKKGGHTLTVSRSALPAHLGHGDYEGSCR